ncbi:MAG TPA: hypothetical protein VMW56_02765 [Candidatus Margulisiibacteriota bacterium]|nr:hypothetical protein [Candidatus Margulisiibacteriota bacterium]
MKDRLYIAIGAAAVIVVATLIWLSNRHDVQHEVQRDEAATAPDNPEARVFALQAESTADKKVRVTMRSLPTSGPVVTIVTQVDYDTGRLKMNTCTISPDIGEGTASAKVLHLAEPQPGLVRAVVVGKLEELPAAANVLACDFAVQPGAPAGPTVVRVHGQVADTTFEDRPFAVEKTIVIKN